MSTDKQNVVVQGLGFVGAAMAIAVADAKNRRGEPLFNVTGLDLDTEEGRKRIDAINAGKFPFKTIDGRMDEKAEEARQRNNLNATSDSRAIESADILLISVNLDVKGIGTGSPEVDFAPFRKAAATIGSHIRENSLVIVETTVPPGTCTRILKPELAKHLTARSMDPATVHIAHSYERVMPGADYFDSIVNFWRVYAGTTEKAADLCGQFLSKVINVKEYPLTRLHSTEASETAKVLENSYRAVTIAFMEEWGRFAEDAGINIFQVIDAIRVRPTHSNMRQPGFGVGGYCLTKDPLMAKIAARDLLKLHGHDFPFSTSAVKTNREMPLVTLEKIRDHFGTLSGKRILLLGISYRQDVGDTRNSPSEIFTREALKLGAAVIPEDPFVNHWDEMNLRIEKYLPDPCEFDAVVLAVPHGEYRDINFETWLKGRREILVVDANNVLTRCQYSAIAKMKNPLISTGRG